MKKRKKKRNIVLIDLNERGSIRIIPSVKSNVTQQDILEFEKRLSAKYNNYCDFTELCIKKNVQENSGYISTQICSNALRSMLEQNIILAYMIKEQNG